MSSFAFMHSHQLGCERDRTVFVMVDPNFQANNVRWSGTPRVAAVDSRGFCHRASGLGSCGMPNRCMGGTRGVAHSFSCIQTSRLKRDEPFSGKIGGILSRGGHMRPLRRVWLWHGTEDEQEKAVGCLL